MPWPPLLGKVTLSVTGCPAIVAPRSLVLPRSPATIAPRRGRDTARWHETIAVATLVRRAPQSCRLVAGGPRRAAPAAGPAPERRALRRAAPLFGAVRLYAGQIEWEPSRVLACGT